MASERLSQLPPSRIDTDVYRDYQLPSPLNTADLEDPFNPYIVTPPTTTHSRGVPSLSISTFANADLELDRTILKPTQPSNANSRALNESKKLLSHVLFQLLNRSQPPPISDTIKEVGRDATEHSVDPFAVIFREVAKFGKIVEKASSRLDDNVQQTDSDEENEQSFSTESIFDLMVQLKDLLVMSISQGWHIFGEDASLFQETSKGKEEKSASLLRRSRQSFQSSTKHVRSASPTVGKVHDPELLSLCITILSSIISEDCRFQITSPRPSRPPNSLQAISLSVAQFLIHTHRHDPKVISRIGFAVIPAFSTFQPDMYGRLISFFEDVVIRGLLESLRRSQGFSNNDNPSVLSPVENQTDATPIVSIQIEEVQGDPTPSSQKALLKIQSSNSPHQSPTIYYLASLIAPLLASILETIDIGTLHPSHELSRRFNRLVNLISTLKVDSYNDLLQVVAYHSTKSRKQACALLSSLWPKVIGHAMISRSLSVPLTLDWNKPSSKIHMPDPEGHQFVPWQFIHKSSWTSVQSTPQHICSFCSTGIHGFGLLCPFCLCAVHFDCYEPPDGSLVVQYRMAGDPNVRKLAMYRFSHILPGRDSANPVMTPKQHSFQTITLITLCLCYVCRQPLWGNVAQGLKCAGCSLIAHCSCLTSPSLPICGSVELDSESMTIDFNSLRQSAISYFPEIRWNYEHLGMLSYEEVLVIYDTLRTQLQLLTNGIALGSLVVTEYGNEAPYTKDLKIDQFEVHQTLEWCKDLLGTQRLQRSIATADYMEENEIGYLEHSMLYDLSTLVYLSTSMKSPISLQTASPLPSSLLLNVNQPESLFEKPTESVAHPYDAVPLAHLREILNAEFNIHVPGVVKVLLNHLHHLSFFERLEPTPVSFSDTLTEDSAVCIFPLPLGLDLSTDVETLVTTIEVCLLDLDLSVNEFAFLLLVRRFWPNGLMSEYGLKRLARSLLNWIIMEDDNLATILRDYIAKQKHLPGVRLPTDMAPWPFSRPSRHGSDAQSSNGRDYLAVRNELLSRYAMPWLLALHMQDKDAYCQMLYDACVELAEDRIVGNEIFDSQAEELGPISVKRADATLFCIIKICHASVAFSAFEDLIFRWLQLVTELFLSNKSVTALNRLFPRAEDTAAHVNGLTDPDHQLQGHAIEATASKLDPFSSLIATGKKSPEKLQHALKWLIMIARSGIDIPKDILDQFLLLVIESPSNLIHSQSLVYAIMLSLWPKSFGRQDLQTILAKLHASLATCIVAIVKSREPDLTDIWQASLTLIRQTLAASLLTYGCDRAAVLDARLVDDNEIKELPSRRKLGSRASAVVDPIFIEPGLLQAIGHYLRLESTTITCYIAKFFHLFFTNSPLIASYEVDNFILRNSGVLADCAWQFYGIQRHEIAALRSQFLLRILIVDSEPFQMLIDDGLNVDLHWERRLVTMNRLSRIVADITSPAFHIDGRQWRSSVADVFISFFSLLWQDPQEEIQQSTHVFSTSLLPAQLEGISQCWNEALSKSPMKDRIKLVSFLIQLRPHFPGWRLVSWNTLIETMVEFHLDSGTDVNDLTMQSSYSSQNDPDMAHLIVSLLILSMLLIADGVEIDSFSLLKIKIQLVKLIGFSDISVIPLQDPGTFQIQYGEATDLPELAFPCLEVLVSVVDAPHYVDLPANILGIPQEQDNQSLSVLVGYIFVDVVLNLIATVEQLESLPVFPIKSLLEAVYVILHKYDFEVYPARMLQPPLRQAIGRIVELVSRNVNYEIRQLALTVTQAFSKRCSPFMGLTTLTILEHVTESIASQGHNNQDTLLIQGKIFITNILTSHANNGLLLTVFKRQLKPVFFLVLKQVFDSQEKGIEAFPEPLASVLLRDTLSRVPESDSMSMQVVINNLSTFVERVHHENYQYDLVTYVGQQISALMRRMSDSMLDWVDSSPLLTILALLARSNRKHSRELLPYIETTLRIALTRANLTSACLVQLINATQLKIQDSTGSIGKAVATLLEILSDGLRMKGRVLPSTLSAIIETLTSKEIPIFPKDPEARFKMLMLNLVENACYFLDHHLWLDMETDADFNASIAVARVVLQALQHDPTATPNATDQDTEVTYNLVNSMRSWIILAIAALQENDKKWVLTLFLHFSSFTQTYASAMRPHLQSNLTSDSITIDINHAYVAIKIWLLVARKVSTLTGGGDAPVLRVWNDLWIVFEGVISEIEVEAQAGLSSTLMTLVSTSVADLFLFSSSLRIPMTLEMTKHIEIFNRLKATRGETSTSKVTRSFRGISETPFEYTIDRLIEQATKELIATEHLRTAEVKREFGRVAGDRYKKDVRVMT